MEVITKGTQEAEARAHFAGHELAQQAVARVASFGEGVVESLTPGTPYVPAQQEAIEL